MEVSNTHNKQSSNDVPLVPVSLNREVVPGARIEGRLEQHNLIGSSGCTRPESQGLRFTLWQGCRIGAERGASLQRPLVASEVVRLDENKLVLMGVVKRLRCVLLNAEVQRGDALDGRVGAIIRNGEQFSTAESILRIPTR